MRGKKQFATLLLAAGSLQRLHRALHAAAISSSPCVFLRGGDRQAAEQPELQTSIAAVPAEIEMHD